MMGCIMKRLIVIDRSMYPINMDIHHPEWGMVSIQHNNWFRSSVINKCWDTH